MFCRQADQEKANPCKTCELTPHFPCYVLDFFQQRHRQSYFILMDAENFHSAARACYLRSCPRMVLRIGNVATGTVVAALTLISVCTVYAGQIRLGTKCFNNTKTDPGFQIVLMPSSFAKAMVDPSIDTYGEWDVLRRSLLSQTFSSLGGTAPHCCMHR